MNFQAICVANITGFLLILSLLISRFITYKSGKAEDRIFSAMMYIVLIACLVEVVTFYADGKPGAVSYWVNMIGSTYLYGANAVGSFLFCVYVDENLYHSKERAGRIYNRFSRIVLILLITLIVNIPFGFYFYIDADNVYHRQPLVNLFYVYMLLCCMHSIAVLYLHRRRYGKVAFFPIYMYLTPIITGSVLQMVIYGTSLAWLGTAIGVVALYMSMLSQSSYLDALTGLYNRLFLVHSMYRMQKSSNDYYGIMFDMDYFKSINDTYGHSAGDQALKDAAYIFKTATQGTHADVFRYAGDEFIIIMQTANEDDVKLLENKLREETDRFNENSDREYKIGFSMGHAHYDRGTDTDDIFLKKIDNAMYQNKELRKTEANMDRKRH